MNNQHAIYAQKKKLPEDPDLWPPGELKLFSEWMHKWLWKWFEQVKGRPAKDLPEITLLFVDCPANFDKYLQDKGV